MRKNRKLAKTYYFYDKAITHDGRPLGLYQEVRSDKPGEGICFHYTECDISRLVDLAERVPKDEFISQIGRLRAAAMDQLGELRSSTSREEMPSDFFRKKEYIKATREVTGEILDALGVKRIVC